MEDKQQILKSIEQLIQSNTSANNYLALTLLCQQLNLSFHEAFAKLPLREQAQNEIYGISQYQIEILDYSIFFSIEHCWDNNSDFPYLAIRRFVKQGNQRLKQYDLYISVDYFESEKERDMYEALVGLSNLGEGLEELFTL